MSGLRQNESNSPDAIYTAEIARRLLCEPHEIILEPKELDDFEEDLIEDSDDDPL
jgi:hypothetical protein